MKPFKSSSFINAVVLSAAILGFADIACAKDALKVSFDDESQGFQFDTNGNPLTSGTYAVGTIKIHMIVVGTTWPPKLPADVILNLAVEERKKKPATNYTHPIPIRLRDVGAGLELVPNVAEFDVDGPSWTDQSIVEVFVPLEIREDEAMNADGTVLVGNLRTETTSRKSRFGTVTTVKIHAMLVHPDECLKTATFVTDEDLDRNLSSNSDVGLEITWGYDNNDAFFYGVDPSPLRDNIIIVNTCEDPQQYDVKIGLPAGFQKKSSGNVVESSISANASRFNFSDPYLELKDAIDQSEFSAPTGGITTLCVESNTLLGYSSQWLSAKVEVAATHPIHIPDAPGYYTPFTSDLYEGNTCTTPHSESTGPGTAAVRVKSKTCVVAGRTKSCSPP